MSFTVRRMREEDIPQVVEIERVSFSRPWTKSIFKAVLLLPYTAYYVAVEDTDSEDTDSAAGREDPVDPEDRADRDRSMIDYGSAQEKIVGLCGVKKVFEEGDISNVAVHPA